MNRLFTPKDLRNYSVTRAIADTITHHGPVGLEKEIHDELKTFNKRTYGIPTDGIAVPFEALATRDLTTGTAAQGGNLIQNTLGTIVDILRAKSIALRNGATFVRDIKSGETLPRQSGTATVYWSSETGAVTAADSTFDQVPLTPHRVVGMTNYSKQLFFQTNSAIEGFIQNDLSELIATGLDYAAVLGSGASNQPRGIVNTTGVGSITLGGPTAYSNLVEFERTLAAANVDTTGPQPPVWLASPNTRAKLRQKTRQAAGVEGQFCWTDDDQSMLGYKAEVSTQLTSTNQLIFGSMMDLVVATFGGLDVVVDPVSLAANREIRLTVNLFADIVLRHPASFTISADSAAQ